MVMVQLIVGNTFQAVASASAGDGQLYVLSSYGAYPDDCSLPILAAVCTPIPYGSVEIIVTQTPNQAPSQPFSAPGLGLGGEATWKYVWDFRGLTND
jgi:hypothetical protein